LPDPLLERLDPLADRRGRHVQPFGGRVEAAMLDHGGERRELLTVDQATQPFSPSTATRRSSAHSL
jgi:hypothetical protein